MRKKSFLAPWGYFSRRGMKGALVCMATGVLLLASCQKGADCDEVWESTVTDKQLESPALENIVLTRVSNSDGTQSMKVTWPVVYGASGYECIVKNVTDAAKPVEVFNKLVDGTSFTFPRERDRNYAITVKAIGNEALNNSDALSATLAEYSSFVQPVTIPSGDLLTGINEYLKFGDSEYIFNLEAGGEYTLNGELDFSGAIVTLNGDAAARPVIIYGTDGVIRTSAGLSVDNINFDCGAQENKEITGVVELSANPPQSASAEARGIVSGKSGSIPDCFILSDPLILKNCAFKDVKKCLFSVGHGSWGVDDVRVEDCIVQFNTAGQEWSNASVISAYTYN